MDKTSPSAMIVLDRTLRFEHVCDEAETYLERPRAKLLGREPWAVFPKLEQSAWKPRIIAAARARAPSTRVVELEARRFAIRAVPAPANSVFLFHEVAHPSVQPHMIVAAPARARGYFEAMFGLDARLTFARTLDDAVIQLELQDDVDMLLTTLDFDDSRALQLLQHARARAASLPLVCARLPFHDTRRLTSPLDVTLGALSVDVIDVTNLAGTIGFIEGQRRFRARVFETLDARRFKPGG